MIHTSCLPYLPQRPTTMFRGMLAQCGECGRFYRVGTPDFSVHLSERKSEMEWVLIDIALIKGEK